MGKPRQYTEDEVREMFLRHVWLMIDYWDANKQDKREAMEGLAFSILTTLDGCAMALPGFAVIPQPHPDDKQFCIGEGENWFPPFDTTNPCDIGGGLHEVFHNFRRTQRPPQGEGG